MKSKILTLIIGILIGAIITSAGFIIYNKVNSKNKKRNFDDRPQMRQSQSLNQSDGTSPKRPKSKDLNSSDDNTTSTQENTTQENVQTESTT